MMANGRKPISSKVRFSVFERDHYTCQCCGAKAPDVTLQLDHINPVAKGGDDSEINLRAICVTCNLGKGDCMPTDRTNESLEPNKHPLVGWAFLSYVTNENDKDQLEWQGEIANVFSSGSAMGDVAIVDFFSWVSGSHTNSALISISELAAPPSSPRFFKLFRTWQERNEFWERVEVPKQEMVRAKNMAKVKDNQARFVTLEEWESEP